MLVLTDKLMCKETLNQIIAIVIIIIVIFVYNNAVIVVVVIFNKLPMVSIPVVVICRRSVLTIILVVIKFCFCLYNFCQRFIILLPALVWRGL